MKKQIKSKKGKNKKGFTLVELLAVIIILAIVVGITIPAVLTTTNNAKKKAFKTAAQSVADWVDRQYQAYTSGATNYGLVTLDENFTRLCVRTCHTSGTSCSGAQINDKTADGTTQTYNDYYNANDADKCNCDCDHRLTYLTSEFIVAAGLDTSNIRSVANSVATYSYIGIRANPSGNLIKTTTASTSYSMSDNVINTSKVYINPQTGRSCVTLKSTADSESYPPNQTVCGGVCQSTDKTMANYCSPTI